MPAVAGYDPNPSDNVGVEVSFTASPDGVPTWTDVTSYVDLEAGISITRGRADEFSQIQPSSCSLTLDNHDGRFTAANAASPYYPNVLPYRKMRVFYTAPGSGVRTYRFTGYVEEWPVAWPNGGAYAQAAISATDRLARMGAQLPLQSVIEEVMLSQEPVVYYRLGEESGATSAADSIGLYGHPLTVTQLGSGGTLEFGTATGPPTDGLPAPTFTRVDGDNGKCLTGSLSPLLSVNGSVSVRCSFLSSTVAQQILVQLDSPFVNGELWLYITAAGKLAVNGGGFTYVPPGSSADSLSIVSAATVTDGLTHDAAVVLTPTTASLYLDGSLVGSDTYDERVALDGFNRLRLGGSENASRAGGAHYLLNGVLSHVAVFDHTLTAAQVAEQYEATSAGFSGDTSDERIARLAAWAGVDSADLDLDAGSSTSICFVDTTGVAALTAMQDVTATEGGRLFIGRSGLLTFHSRDRVSDNPAAVATIDANILGPDTTLRMSTADLINDVTGKRPTGAEIRVFDQASIDTYGPKREGAFTLLVTSDAEVTDALNWMVAGNGQPQVRMPQAQLDLYTDTTGTQEQLRNLDLGDRLTVTGLPSQAPWSSVDLVVEGYTETISLTGWLSTANLSNYSTVQAFILDDDTYGLLDADNRLTY